MESEDWEPTEKVLEFECRRGIKRQKLESGTLEARQILSEPELVEKLIEGKKTPLSECMPGSEGECKIVCVFGKKWLLFGKN